MTDRIRSERIVTEAIIDGLQARRKTMALAEKMKRLAERSMAVPKSLDAWADEHLAKWDTLEARGQESFGKLGQVMADVENGVVAAEDALNQLTNGAPDGPLPS
jgi:hypothetical protein